MPCAPLTTPPATIPSSCRSCCLPLARFRGEARVRLRASARRLIPPGAPALVAHVAARPGDADDRERAGRQDPGEQPQDHGRAHAVTAQVQPGRPMMSCALCMIVHYVIRNVRTSDFITIFVIDVMRAADHPCRHAAEDGSAPRDRTARRFAREHGACARPRCAAHHRDVQGRTRSEL